MADNTVIGERRRWWLAAVLSLVWPGLGQAYSGELRRGVLLYITLAALSLVAVLHVPVPLPLGPLNLVPLLVVVAFGLYVSMDAAAIARRQDGHHTARRYNRWYFYVGYILAAGIAGGVSGVPARMVAKAYYTRSGAMEDALLVGDYMLVDRLAYNPPLEVLGAPVTVFHRGSPHPGDVVVFRSKSDIELDLIMRCVATAGQVVTIVDKQLYVDGEPYSEPPSVKFMDSMVYSRSKSSRDNFGPYTVPENHFFALGDNRDNSADSRFFGPVPIHLAHGRASFIYWSSDLAAGPLHLAAPSIVISTLNFVLNLPSLPFRARYSRLGGFIE